MSIAFVKRLSVLFRTGGFSSNLCRLWGDGKIPFFLSSFLTWIFHYLDFGSQVGNILVLWGTSKYSCISSTTYLSLTAMEFIFQYIIHKIEDFSVFEENSIAVPRLPLHAVEAPLVIFYQLLCSKLEWLMFTSTMGKITRSDVYKRKQNALFGHKYSTQASILYMLNFCKRVKDVLIVLCVLFN